MSQKSAFKNWQEWATTDWREFSLYFNRRYGVVAFGKAEREFAKQMKISTHAIGELTNIAIGKGVEYGVSASIGSVLSIGDILARLAGFGFEAAANMNYGRHRDNPHTLWKSAGLFTEGWVFHEGHLADYVRFILYWYPKDIAAGFYGFRYGISRDGQPAAALRSTKKL